MYSHEPKEGKILSKRMIEASKLVEKGKTYSIDEALDLIEKMPKAKFDETVEMHIKLGVDGKQADQQVRGVLVLPNGTGKSKKVLVIAKADKAEAAKAAGADYVGEDDMINKIASESWLDFDAVIATPDMMPALGKVAKILGPKGLMPNPKSGTVTVDVAKAVTETKAGKIEYRLDKANIVHCPIGKVSFGKEKIKENYMTLLETIIKAKPAAAKGTYLQSVSIASSMGAGIKINTSAR